MIGRTDFWTWEENSGDITKRDEGGKIEASGR
jgi:hypothetical protein